MKRLTIVSILSLLISVSLNAQNFSIYQLNGNVEVKAQGAESWVSAKKRDNLKGNDRIKIPTGATISLVNEETNVIIRDIKSGEYSVREILAASSERSNSLLKSLNKKLYKDIKKESKRNNHYSTYGATTRGLHDEPDFCDSLYSSIFAFYVEKKAFINSGLELKIVSDDAESFHFEIVNNTDKVYFVNVIKAEGGKLSYCIPFRYDWYDVLPLMPSRKAVLSAFSFMKGDGNAEYFLVGAERPYRTIEINSLLNTMEKPECDNYIIATSFSYPTL